MALLETEEKKTDYLRGLYETTYLRDVIERNHLRNPEGIGACACLGHWFVNQSNENSQYLSICTTRTIKKGVNHVDSFYFITPYSYTEIPSLFAQKLF